MVGRRHDIDGVIEGEVEAGYGPMAVVVSGPSGMSDAVREVVAKVAREGKRPIEFFEESFAW